MHPHTQIFFNERPARRTEFACVARINLHARSTSVRSFIVRELYELIPRRITDGLSEAMIPGHACDVQIFKGDDSEQRNESMTELVSEVTAAISDAFVNASRSLALLFSLRLRQRLLIRAKEARVGNLLARRERGKVSESNINSYCFIVCGKWLRFDFNRKARIPFARCGASYRESLNLAFNRAMQLDSQRSDFREAQLAVCHGEAGSSIGETVVAFARTEAREACLLFRPDAAKESVKGFLHSLQDILQHLTVDARHIFTSLFDVRQLVGLLNITHGLSFKTVCVASFLHTRVVEFAAQSKRRLQTGNLRLAWKQAIFEGLALCYIFVSHAACAPTASSIGERGMGATNSIRARLHFSTR